MDALERMALDLEEAQNRRKKKAVRHNSVAAENAFWTAEEFAIFETIKTFRKKSRTYDSSK